MTETKVDLWKLCECKNIAKANLLSSYISRNKIEEKSFILCSGASVAKNLKKEMKLRGKNHAKIINQRLRQVGLKKDNLMRRRGYSESSNYDTKQSNIDITTYPIASTSQESIAATTSPISGILFQPSTSTIPRCITLDDSLNPVRGTSSNLINTAEFPHSEENLREYQKDLEKIVEVLKTTQIVPTHSTGDTTALDDFEFSD